MNKADVIAEITGNSFEIKKETASAFAPSNIALCKYWGKRNIALNLPVTSSLSVSLGELGTHTEISTQTNADRVLLNGKTAPDNFTKRMLAFLDLFRPQGTCFSIATTNNIPTAAGLASSASGFAALVLALNGLYGWQLDRKTLSVLARMGSGSACRSLYQGFVLWHKGNQANGLDSFAEKINVDWPGFCIGVVTVSADEKSVGSTEAMNRTTDTSMFYQSWAARLDQDVPAMLTALTKKQFDKVGRIAEANALAMHATMLDSWPPVLFWQPQTVAMMHRVWALRKEGVPIYLTIDAGPNIKLLFQSTDTNIVKKEFSELTIIQPFLEKI